MESIGPWLVMAGAYAAWQSARYSWWRSTVSYALPRVLMYHMIAPPRRGARFNGMRVSPEAFEWQLKWLRNNGFEFLSISQLIGDAVPERSVAITFDDGFEDNFTAGFPLLKKYRAKATLYLVANRHDGTDWSGKKKAHHQGGELLREPKLSDDQVKEMVASGRVELGAHTLTHANLAALSREEKRREIVGSKEALEASFGVPVTSFAYPFGIWSAADRELVRDAGFLTAVTTDRGIDSLPFPEPLTLRRIKVSGREGRFAFRLRVRTGRRGIWK